MRGAETVWTYDPNGERHFYDVAGPSSGLLCTFPPVKQGFKET